MLPAPNKQSGFTLIELLTVISIISLLSSITVTNVYEARLSARDARRVTDIKAIILTLQEYYLDNGKWPNMRPTISSPDNYYPGTSVQICEPYDSAGMRCSSHQTACCAAALGTACPVDYWIPPLDSLGGYFAVHAPHDPIETPTCPASWTDNSHFYVYYTNSNSNPGAFVLLYSLERRRNYALGREADMTKCDSQRICQYALSGRTDGSISDNP